MLDEGDSSNSGNANSEDLAELTTNAAESKPPATVSEVMRERTQIQKK